MPASRDMACGDSCDGALGRSEKSSEFARLPGILAKSPILSMRASLLLRKSKSSHCERAVNSVRPPDENASNSRYVAILSRSDAHVFMPTRSPHFGSLSIST